MNVHVCRHGHIYDKDKYLFCPHCDVSQVENLNQKILEKLEPLDGYWYFDEQIGKGSSSFVYRLKNITETEFIAAKIIVFKKNEDRRMHSCLEQLFLANRLYASDNIVRAYKNNIYTDKATKWHYLIIQMELLTPLDKYLMDKTSFSEQEIIKLGIDIASALKDFESKEIVHRDIKPDNILVSADGKFKLGDLHTAEELKKAKSTPSIKGTYSYMAPEAYSEGLYNHTCDIYSLGLILYLLTNDNALSFEENDSSVDPTFRRLLREDLLPPKNASEAFSKIIMKACSPKTSDRYQNAEELLNQLSALNTASNDTFDYVYPTKDNLKSAEEKTIFVPLSLATREVSSNNTSNHNNKNSEKNSYDKKRVRFRLSNWFGFTCLFSFIPLFVFLIFVAIFKDKTATDLSIISKCSTEFLYFALSISIITIRELTLEQLWDKNRTAFVIILISLLATLVISTILFGIMTLCDIEILDLPAENNMIHIISITLGIFSLIIGTMVQVWEEKGK